MNNKKLKITEAQYNRLLQLIVETPFDTMLKQNIDIGGLTDVYVDFEEANKYINCNLLDNSGKPVFYDSGFFSFNQGMVWLGSVCDADNPKRFTSHPDFSFEAGTNYVPFYKNQSIYSLLGNTPQLAAKTLS